jgi:hypothetical protein
MINDLFDLITMGLVGVKTIGGVSYFELTENGNKLADFLMSPADNGDVLSAEDEHNLEIFLQNPWEE